MESLLAVHPVRTICPQQFAMTNLKTYEECKVFWQYLLICQQVFIIWVYQCHLTASQKNLDVPTCL